MHPILNTPSSCHGFAWLLIHHDALAFVPVLETRRNHPTPHSPSMNVWLTFTRLVQVHFRYGLHTCALPLSGVGGHVYPALLPGFGRPPHVRHRYAVKLTNYCGRTLTCKTLSSLRTAQNGMSSSESAATESCRLKASWSALSTASIRCWQT